jgi:hypothetical protein
VISTSARLSARAAAMPAKPPPTIKTRFLHGTAFVRGGFSWGSDLVRTVVMDAPTVFQGQPPGWYRIQRGFGLILNGAAEHWTAVTHHAGEGSRRWNSMRGRISPKVMATTIRNELEPIPTDWRIPGGGLILCDTEISRTSGKFSALAELRIPPSCQKRQLR